MDTSYEKLHHFFFFFSCQFSNWMSSAQFQCHRDVINDTKVRIAPPPARSVQQQVVLVAVLVVVVVERRCHHHHHHHHHDGCLPTSFVLRDASSDRSRGRWVIHPMKTAYFFMHNECYP